jgi:hypothetical protein
MQGGEAVNRYLTHGTDFRRMPKLPTPKDLQAMVARLKQTSAKTYRRRRISQKGGSVPKTYRRRRIRQKGGIVKQRRKPLNNVPTHYQYYQ